MFLFKLSSQEGIVNAIRIIVKDKTLRFEALKGAKVEDKVKNVGEKGTI